MARRPSASQTEATNRAAIADPGAQGAERVVKPKSSGEKVTVACKLGVAYYDIYLCREETVSENTQTGPRDVTRYVPIRDNTVRLRGTAYPRGTVPDGFPDRPLIVGGAAMNPGIDKDWFDHWLDQNKKNPLVMNRIIFAHTSLDHVKGEAKELAGVSSGMDPINPKGDPRMPKSTNAAVSNIETEESRASKLAKAAEASVV